MQAVQTAPLAAERRHTYYFQRELRSTAPVFLDTEVDMTRVERLRADARAAGRRYSVVCCVLYAAARVMARHPAANAAISGERKPKVARYEAVNAKLAFDKTMRGERIVLTSVLPDVDRLSLDQIQRWIEQLRDADPATAPEFNGARILQRLPWPLGPTALRAGTRSLAKRAAAVGTFAVSSLGHRAVDGFHSLGGTTVTLGLGQVAERPVARDGRILIAPVMRLNLAFDHRVIDGAEAADVLGDLKDALEHFAPTEHPEHPEHPEHSERTDQPEPTEHAEPIQQAAIPAEVRP